MIFLESRENASMGFMSSTRVMARSGMPGRRENCAPPMPENPVWLASARDHVTVQ